MSIGSASIAGASLKAIQDAAKILRVGETTNDLRAFYANMIAYCSLIRGHLDRIGVKSFKEGHILIIRLEHIIQALVKPQAFLQGRHLASYPSQQDQQQNQAPAALQRCLDLVRQQNDHVARVQIIHACINFGDTHAEQSRMMLSLTQMEEELTTAFPEDLSQWTPDDLSPRKKISEPPYDVQLAAKSIFTALLECKSCSCKSSHDFGAHICLGTYRVPDAAPDRAFDLFFSLEQEWQEARVHAAQESRVQWAAQTETEAAQAQARARAMKAKIMKVKSLCESISKLRQTRKTAYRLELKVTKGLLYKLQSERSTVSFDFTKDPVSLEDFLKRGSRFTEKTKRILAVILSSSILHLIETDWLQPSWNSSNVLFFQTSDSALPLRPYLQTRLSANIGRQCSQMTENVDVEEEDEMDQMDEIDPDDLIQHQCPTLIMLAIVLLEVHFGTTFRNLAQIHGVILDDDVESSSGGARYNDVCFVFDACRDEIPENLQFLRAVDKCLDPAIWEDQDGEPLDPTTLRTRIYQEIVHPLETELLQAYSSIPIHDLDRYAQRVNFGSWDQIILPVSAQSEQKAGTREPSPSPRQTTSFSPSSILSPMQSPETSQVYGFQGQYLQTQYYPNQFKMSPYNSPAISNTELPSMDYTASKFFDDETLPETYTEQAKSSYLTWKSRYQAVYEKLIPETLPTAASPAKIAILDTGIDLTHPDVEARVENIRGKRNWLNSKSSTSVHDRHGHGTFTACLLLDYAPDAEIYVAKIAERTPAPAKVIADAINHAVSTWQVDIISMSFGFPSCDIEGYAELEAALVNAYSNNVLLFAAASNNGGKLGRSFPAREDIVTAIHSTDTNGNRSSFSPTPVTEDFNLATVGEAVESAWPVVLCDEMANPGCVKHKSGTSYATPIAAGIAAFLLMYVRVHLPEKSGAAKRQKRMNSLLKRVAEKGGSYKPRDGYHFIDLSLYSDSLFGKDKSFIDATIRDVLSS